MLVDCAHAVLPQFLLPFRSRKRVGKNTPISVKRHHLTGLLLNRHLRKQIFHSRVNVRRRIFINVLDPVLVQVNPPLVVYLPVLRPELECRVRTGGFGGRKDFCCPAATRRQVYGNLSVIWHSRGYMTVVASRSVCIDTILENIQCPVAFPEKTEVKRQIASGPVCQ